MRVGVMLRALDVPGGIAVYASNLTEELLRLDSQNQYVLFYRSREHLGRFERFANASEVWLPSRSKLTWDQLAVPRACRRAELDVLLHPKFTVPLLAPCPAIMVVHGADWLVPEQARFYSWFDVRFERTAMPLYFRKAALVVSVSRLTTENFEERLESARGKMRTVYFGPARHFARVEDEEARESVLHRYGLPSRFVLTLTRRDGHERKNLANLLAGYRKLHERNPRPPKLVVGGKDCHLLRQEFGLDAEGYGEDVIFPGWIDQADLPAVYSAAELFLYPSNLEAFPIPITEAMACGTPIVTSNVNGLLEIAGDAALLVDPDDPEAIADAANEVLNDPNLRERLSQSGLERSKQFGWERCAREMHRILVEVAG